jgi:hypothetical protein
MGPIQGSRDKWGLPCYDRTVDADLNGTWERPEAFQHLEDQGFSPQATLERTRVLAIWFGESCVRELSAIQSNNHRHQAV